MAKSEPHVSQVGTGSWNLEAPISFFSVATYKGRDGKNVQMPFAVAGERITGGCPVWVSAAGREG